MRRWSVVFLVLSLALAQSVFADDAPPWLRQAAATRMPAFASNVPAVVLLREERVRVDADGRVTTTTTEAVRILTREGREDAAARAVYNNDSEKVREMRGWLVRPSGAVKRYGKDQVLDMALVEGDVYNEARVAVLSVSEDAEPGAVFGYEATVERRSVFTQFDWAFQSRLPALASRLVLQLQPGWKAESVVFNRAPLPPAVAGSTYTWEMHDLPLLEDEPARPSATHLIPRLAVSYFPPAGGPAAIGPTFSTWSAVSRWLSALSDPQAAPDDALAGKAQSLVAGARTELERIQAIGRYAQSVHYISIQTGIGRGGGYRPHAAAEVFTKSYGDCKDKANLMRAMLQAIGITAYPVAIFSGDPAYVREEWPSPQQFNHCIIAIKIGDETSAPAVVRHPALGRLLIFDPTDEHTPVGEIPEHEQGSLALVVAGDAGALIRMPATAPEANRLERDIEVDIDVEGAIRAKVRERSSGQAAADERQQFRTLPRPDYTRMIERWITRSASGAVVSKIEPADSTGDGRFSLDVEFAAPLYAKSMRRQLLVFRPVVIASRESAPLTRAERKYPVALDPEAIAERIRVKLPAGFAVDEVPEAVRAETPFARYSIRYEVQGEELVVSRELIQQRTIIPVAEYAAVRSFFERVAAADQAPVVLARK